MRTIRPESYYLLRTERGSRGEPPKGVTPAKSRSKQMHGLFEQYLVPAVVDLEAHPVSRSLWPGIADMGDYLCSP